MRVRKEKYQCRKETQKDWLDGDLEEPVIHLLGTLQNEGLFHKKLRIQIEQQSL